MIRFRCPHCAALTSVSDDRAGITAKCPHCRRPVQIPALVAEAADLVFQTPGATRRTRKSSSWPLLVALALGLALVSAVGLILVSRDQAGASGGLGGPASLADAPGEAEITVSSQNLWNAYRANPETADQKYKGKVLRVTGTVTIAIEPDFVGLDLVEPTIHAGTFGPARSFQEAVSRQDNYPPSIRCFMAPGQREGFLAAQKARGRQVTLVGRCEGAILRPEVWKDPVVQLSQCRLISAPPPTRAAAPGATGR